MICIRNEFTTLVKGTHQPFHIRCMNAEGDGLPIELDINLIPLVIVTNLVEQLIVMTKCAHGCNS